MFGSEYDTIDVTDFKGSSSRHRKKRLYNEIVNDIQKIIKPKKGPRRPLQCHTNISSYDPVTGERKHHNPRKRTKLSKNDTQDSDNDLADNCK